DQRRLGANLARPETRAGTIGGAAVVGNPDDRDIEAARFFDVRQPHERRRLREPRRLERSAGLVRHASSLLTETPPPPAAVIVRAAMQSRTRERLHGSLSTVEYFTFGFGTMIGVGWLVLMDDWLGRGGPAGGILGYLIGGLLLFPIAHTYGRLVQRIQDA